MISFITINKLIQFRILFLLIFAVVAGLFWDTSISINMDIAHFIAPPILALAIVVLWPATLWYRQLVLVPLWLFVSEVVRCFLYGVKLNGFRYITGDAETQIFLGLSFGAQIIIGLLAWGLWRFVFRQELLSKTNKA